MNIAPPAQPLEITTVTAPPLATVPVMEPRSGRMDGHLSSRSLPVLRTTSMYETSSLGRPTPKTLPPLPARSPLRVRPRAIFSSSQILEDARNLAAQVDDTPSQRTSAASMAALLESMELANNGPPTPSPSDSQSVISIENEAELSSSSLASPLPTIAKRTHALLEILTSERAYANDLLLIRQIHIPLALGMTYYIGLSEPILTYSRPPGAISHKSTNTPLIGLIYAYSFDRL